MSEPKPRGRSWLKILGAFVLIGVAVWVQILLEDRERDREMRDEINDSVRESLDGLSADLDRKLEAARRARLQGRPDVGAGALKGTRARPASSGGDAGRP